MTGRLKIKWMKLHCKEKLFISEQQVHDEMTMALSMLFNCIWYFNIQKENEFVVSMFTHPRATTQSKSAEAKKMKIIR